MSNVRPSPAKATKAVVDAIPVGQPLMRLLDVAWRARRAVLLEGPTGIGKSELVAQFCAARGLGCTVLDLSLLEPPDLVGLPVIRDGRTHYAPPVELPTEGEGILLLEELNRAELAVLQPALQLLSARRLHTYVLPAGWICVAAVNPEGDDYDVRRMDAALRGRFLQASVRADREEWLRWAEVAEVHPVLTSVVAAHPDVFATSSPRAWTYLSDTWSVMGPDEFASPLRATVAHGYLPAAWAKLAAAAVDDQPAAPHVEAADLLTADGAQAFADLCDQLRLDGRTDLLLHVAWQVRRLLPQLGALDRHAFGQLVGALPGDVRQRCLDRFDALRASR